MFSVITENVMKVFFVSKFGREVVLMYVLVIVLEVIMSTGVFLSCFFI